MRITPLDVRKQEFRKAMRGLDPEEVYAFLSTVADEYELVLNDNKALRERLLELDDKVQEYRTMEKTLRDTLVTAERVNAEAKDNARREAGIIIKEAQIEAEKALRDIKNESIKLHQQVQQLRGQRDSFLARMKVVAQSHLSYIESAVADFQKEETAADLADKPVEREEELTSDEPVLLLDEAMDVAEAHVEPQPSLPSKAERPQPLPPPPAHPASPVRPEPQPPARPSSPERPQNADVAGQHPRADRPRVAPASEGPDPITMIIDRMKRGQEEVLAAGSGTPGYPDAAPSRTEPRTPTPAAKAEERDEQPTPNDRGEVTREFRLDDIRRELAADRNPDR